MDTLIAADGNNVISVNSCESEHNFYDGVQFILTRRSAVREQRGIFY